jgi:hypothetical protein
MLNILSDVGTNEVMYNFPGGNVIADSYCTFSKDSIKVINKSVHITPSIGDYEGWYVNENMELETVKRNIQSGMLKFLKSFTYGTFKMDVQFHPFSGGNLTIGLFSADYSKRILLLLTEGTKFLTLSRFYSGFSTPEKTFFKKNTYHSPVKIKLQLVWGKDHIFIYHNQKLVNSLHIALEEPMYPYIGLNISKPNIPYPDAKPLIINYFTYER